MLDTFRTFVLINLVLLKDSFLKYYCFNFVRRSHSCLERRVRNYFGISGTPHPLPSKLTARPSESEHHQAKINHLVAKQQYLQKQPMNRTL
jgi:hypothetical protein